MCCVCVCEVLNTLVRIRQLSERRKPSNFKNTTECSDDVVAVELNFRLPRRNQGSFPPGEGVSATALSDGLDAAASSLCIVTASCVDADVDGAQSSDAIPSASLSSRD